jgi:putative transposase
MCWYPARTVWAVDGGIVVSTERIDRATRVALARWQVIAAAVDERLSRADRGLLLSEIAGQAYRDADGRPRRVTVRTLYRWLAAWQAGGFEGLKPARRRDAGTHRADPAVLELAAALRREAPARSAPQISDILARTRGVGVHPRTLQRYFAANGPDRARLEGRHRAYGRFEAAACGDLWTADAWDGPPVAELGGRHAQLFSILDDHSRLVPHANFYPDVGERSFQHCLRTALARRGLPRVLYVDNGSAFVSGQLRLICARLGIRTTHTPPYRPQGRGKTERAFRTIAEQFAVEVAAAGVDSLADLNRYWMAWVEQVYHQRVHSGTGQAPLERWLAGPTSLRPAPDPNTLAAAFQWAVLRTVTRTRGVSLHGNTYLVAPSLVGRRVELRYDPEDLTRVTVWYQGQPAGEALPEQVKAHVDPKLRRTDPAQPGPPTGIGYLEAVAACHATALAAGVAYHQPAGSQDTDGEREQAR